MEGDWNTSRQWVLKNTKHTRMKKHIPFPSIEQFRNCVAGINRKFNFVGLDEKNNPIYDPTLKKPVLKFFGTVKLHGTNAGVCFNWYDGLWSQSREHIISIDKDNAGFAFFVHEQQQLFEDIMFLIAEKNNHLDLKQNTISIFGEWAGKGIQKGVGISQIDKSFYIFGVKITPEEGDAYWVDHSYLKAAPYVYNINDFPTYEIEIDFNMPKLVQNDLAKITQGVEESCPVAEYFGIKGLGEGVVWICDYKGQRWMFKVKGEKHSTTNVKTLANVDVEKLNSINEFISYAVTQNRFEQALGIVFQNGQEIDIKKMGDVIRWVVNDIIKEESDTLKSNNLEPKDINKYVSSKVREMFNSKLC